MKATAITGLRTFRRQGQFNYAAKSVCAQSVSILAVRFPSHAHGVKTVVRHVGLDGVGHAVVMALTP